MDIQFLGAWGEFFGGIAVLVSLVYLGLQLRQNNKMAVVAGYQRGQDELQRHFQFLAQNPDLVDIQIRGLKDYRALKPLEQARFHYATGPQLAMYHSTWKAYRDGAVDHEIYDAYEQQVLSMLREPGGSEYWKDVRQLVSPQLQVHLDGLLRTKNFRVPVHTEAFIGWNQKDG